MIRLSFEIYPTDESQGERLIDMGLKLVQLGREIKWDNWEDSDQEFEALIKKIESSLDFEILK